MKIDIKTNIKEVTKDLTVTQKKQIPFATANAINTTLFQLRKEMGKQTVKKLDNPTPFTQKGFMVTKASKLKLFGELFIKEAVAKYLNFQIEGGVRSNSKKFAIPTRNAKLNQYAGSQIILSSDKIILNSMEDTVAGSRCDHLKGKTMFMEWSEIFID